MDVDGRGSCGNLASIEGLLELVKGRGRDERIISERFIWGMIRRGMVGSLEGRIGEKITVGFGRGGGDLGSAGTWFGWDSPFCASPTDGQSLLRMGGCPGALPNDLSFLPPEEMDLSNLPRPIRSIFCFALLRQLWPQMRGREKTNHRWGGGKRGEGEGISARGFEGTGDLV